MSETIASITLSSNRSKIISDALGSVKDFVDCFIIVDLGTDQKTRNIAEAIGGDKVRYIKCDPKASCAEMRNVGLNFAHHLGYTWGLMLDTDERIITNGINIRETLSHCKQDCVCLNSTCGTYMKEKFFRLPAHWYVGHAHEFIKYDELGLMPAARFFELPKSKAKEIKRLKDSLPALNRQIKAEPYNARWVWYKAFTLEGLGRYSDAVKFYLLSMHKPMPSIQEAWVHFRIATCQSALGHSDLVNHHCQLALDLYPSYCEAYCLLAVMASEKQDLDNTIHYVNKAIECGPLAGNAIDMSIIRNPYALFEGPYEVIKSLNPACDGIDALIEGAKAKRAAWQGGPA